MVALLATAASNLFQNATASTLMDETLKNGYPTLYAASSNSANAIIRKFPFLTTFESLANALEDAGIIASSQQNPASLTKHQMAEKIEDYLDSFLNFSTGFIPKAIKDTYENNGYTMSQQDFWKNTPGLYKILEDPGNGASAVSLTSAGHHYVNAPTNVNCNAPNDTAGVIATDITAQISAALATSSFISYADFTNDSSVDFVDVNTANSGIDSDDVIGFSFEVDGGKGTDTSGSVLAMNLHYPMGLSTPGDTHIRADKDGKAGTSASSNKQDVDMLDFLTPSEAELTSKSTFGATAGGYTGTITFHSNTNVISGSSSVASTKCAVTHIASGVGFSGQSNNMSGGGSDVTPAFGLVFPHFADQPVKWSAPTSYTDVAIADLQATDSSFLPSDFDLTGLEVIEDGTTAGSTTSDGGELTFHEGVLKQCWQPYGGALPSDSIALKLNLTSNKIQIKKNGSFQLQGWGCPFFQFKVTYNSTSESATGATKTFDVAFHRLCNWTLDFARACPVVRTIGVGVTGNSTANVTDDSGATVGITGFQGPFSLASATVATEGAGYDSSQSITCTLPTADGRFYQSIYGGKNITTRSNNNPTIKNAQATGTVSITNSRVARQVETIYHDTKNFGLDGTSASSFRTRGFLGADFTVEKDDFARRLTLNSSGQVTAIDTANATVNTTVGKDTAPGLIYNDETFHTTQNPHGSDTSYVANTFGEGSADVRDFAKDKGLFSVTISGGKVTAITPTARDDAAGVSCPGGYNYPDSSDYTQLTFIRNSSVSEPSTFRNARVYYRANTAAANGVGKRATVDITDATQEFDAGSNLPDNFYSEAFAFGEGLTASAVNPNTDFVLDTDFTTRNWKPTLNPASVRVGVERPVLKTQSRSLKTKTVGTGAHRFTFEFEYPLMTQTEAEEIINLFDKYKGATNEIQLYIPSNAIKHLGAESADPGIIMSRRPVLIANAGVGSNEVVVDGFQDSATTTIPAGTHFTIQGQKKIYKVVQSGAADQYGRTELRIEPPLLTASTNFFLDTDNFLQDRRDYFLVRAFLEDDFLDYTVTADDLYKLSTIKFRESI
tara:strand:+ start:1805 stop:5005 length:3201 start_codon:yes stop_codon:yes gene_type:complete